MPSDKRYSITVKATGLIFVLLVVILPIAAASVLASWFYQNSP